MENIMDKITVLMCLPPEVSMCWSYRAVSEEAKNLLLSIVGSLCTMNSEPRLPTIMGVVSILSKEFKSNRVII